jgi:hypothetical protein
MRAVLEADLPAPPPDPIATVAQQLGVSREQVCAALFDSGAVSMAAGAVTSSHQPRRGPILLLNGHTIDLSADASSELSGPARRLGVSPDRLAAALRAAVPAPESVPPPLSQDELIKRLAANLGLSQDTVRTALREVSSSGGLDFVIHLPALSR